jgi:hypothetical protein
MPLLLHSETSIHCFHTHSCNLFWTNENRGGGEDTDKPEDVPDHEAAKITAYWWTNTFNNLRTPEMRAINEQFAGF